MDLNINYDKFKKYVEQYEEALLKDYDGMRMAYDAWCVFLDHLVLMPICDCDPDAPGVDVREYCAVTDVFSKLSGAKKESVLAKYFFMFYEGWSTGYYDGYRRALNEQTAASCKKGKISTGPSPGLLFFPAQRIGS